MNSFISILGLSLMAFWGFSPLARAAQSELALPELSESSGIDLKQELQEAADYPPTDWERINRKPGILTEDEITISNKRLLRVEEMEAAGSDSD